MNPDKIARLVSEITVPPFFSTIIFFIYSFYLIPAKMQALLVASTLFFLTALVPTLYLIYQLSTGKINHRHVPDKTQRTVPYLIGGACFLTGFVIMSCLKVPRPILALLLASAVNVIVITMLNLKWKLSGHALGAAAGVAALLVLFGWKVLGISLVIVLVGWSRLQLKAHSLTEVIAGAALGFGLTLMQMNIYLRLF